MSKLDTNQLIQRYKEGKISFAEIELTDARLDLLTDYKALREYHNYAMQMQNTVNELQSTINAMQNSFWWKAGGIFRVIKRKLCKKPPFYNDDAQTQPPPFELSTTQKNLLFLDLHLPTPDMDAGSRSVYQYLLAMQKLGVCVTYLCDDFPPDSKDTEMLREINVQVLNHKYYADNWQQFIADEGCNFDYFIFNRPLCASKYMDIIKQNTKGKLIYLGCDLHFLREERCFEQTKEPKKLEEINRIKLKEFVIMSKADHVLMYSPYEKEVILKEFGLNNVTVTPLYCLDIYGNRRKPFFETKDVLFVGGFNHAPNVDGILWFYKEVWTKCSLGDAKLIIAGANPTAEITELSSNNVVVTGYVSSEKLEELYANCRVCVIPLRYGAGIKGKTVEAMAQSIPIVTTSMGIEGIEDIKSTGLISADSSEEFIKQLEYKYNNEESTYYENCLQANFSEEKLLDALKSVIN